MASWLVHSAPYQAVRVHAMATEDFFLCVFGRDALLLQWLSLPCGGLTSLLPGIETVDTMQVPA